MSAEFFYPPDGHPKYPYNHGTSVFLAGTIEMGNSEDWQAKVSDELKEFDINVFNPRRVVPPAETNEIIEQINWELESINLCNVIYMHLSANSISPISLFELGLLHNKALSKRVIIYCDPDYTRKLNVWTTVNHSLYKSPNISLYSDYEDSLNALKQHLKMVKVLSSFT